ncbi:hypothetical protein Tco_0873671 [Tanacetum coccineum]|uniref:Uncharacterized protein n=1 Tax=Tanacetum coccineum TaxID=301880 RepID=A0ABQ5BJG1_9ASTR
MPDFEEYVVSTSTIRHIQYFGQQRRTSWIYPIRRIHQEDMAYLCLHFTKDLSPIRRPLKKGRELGGKVMAVVGGAIRKLVEADESRILLKITPRPHNAPPLNALAPIAPPTIAVHLQCLPSQPLFDPRYFFLPEEILTPQKRAQFPFHPPSRLIFSTLPQYLRIGEKFS